MRFLLFLHRRPSLFFLPTLLATRPVSVVALSSFAKTVRQWLEYENIPWKPCTLFQEQGLVIQVGENTPHSFLVHLLPSPQTPQDCVSPTLTRDMTDKTTTNQQEIVHLHQDIWQSQTSIVQSRLRVKAGKKNIDIINNNNNQRLFARKTTVERITGDVARDFFTQHHLWGATKAKYIYGLFHPTDSSDEYSTRQLVAAASFSAHRTVLRDSIPFQSYELLRFCTRQDTTIVGGLSKLIQAFIRDQQPDDIVTQIDRDWGSGKSWCNKLGFTSVQVMPPLVMAIGKEDGVRRHMVGAGIRYQAMLQSQDAENGNKTLASGANLRVGLPLQVLQELEQLRSDSTPIVAINCLEHHGFYPVYDAGVERLCMIVPESTAMQTIRQRLKGDELLHPDNTDDLTEYLWGNSLPRFPMAHYSDNPGIMALLTSPLPAITPDV